MALKGSRLPTLPPRINSVEIAHKAGGQKSMLTNYQQLPASVSEQVTIEVMKEVVVEVLRCVRVVVLVSIFIRLGLVCADHRSLSSGLSVPGYV